MNEKKTDEKIVTVARFNDSMEAEIAKQKLEQFGIKSVITGKNFTDTYSGILSSTELQTFQSDSERAKEILQNEDAGQSTQ